MTDDLCRAGASPAPTLIYNFKFSINIIILQSPINMNALISYISNLKSIFILTVLIILTNLITVNAQQLEGSISLHGFADNREYAKSNRFSQTIFGTRFSPEIGLLLDSIHRIRVGFNALHEFGSPKFTAKIDPVIYYQYKKEKPFHVASGF